ncbi:MAG: quinone-dependent dihydroorotate dehydrogenase [Armatimonadetes bacterium]|nr:quinone-dependent dihydroorotate dehydrogenase [Armatimonadota bacterium]
MGLYESLIRPALFSLDAERAHRLGLWAVSHGLVQAPRPSDLPLSRFGVDFRHPVGLAAGFDKDGTAIDRWEDLGFAFVELGTVTRHPQPGNARPRLFRLPEDRAVINRMGFNNEGSEALARRLETARPGIPVGVNIGKSKVTPMDEAPRDYEFSFRLLAPLADYVVVNVSSPNTPGLRGLQEKGPLHEILLRLRAIDPDKPLFVKVAPDLDGDSLDDIAEVVSTTRLTGVVATNTTVSRDGLARDPGQDGGLSGAPLKPMADRALSRLKSSCPEGTVFIGVGGVMSAADAQDKLDLGADLVQIYTGWIYGGPSFVADLVEGLTRPPMSVRERDPEQTGTA